MARELAFLGFDDSKVDTLELVNSRLSDDTVNNCVRSLSYWSVARRTLFFFD
jgi:hypothetical protein